jgi:hypothetical protein
MTSNNLNGLSTHLIKSIALSTIEPADFVAVLMLLTSTLIIGVGAGDTFLTVLFTGAFLTGVGFFLVVVGFAITFFVAIDYFFPVPLDCFTKYTYLLE